MKKHLLFLYSLLGLLLSCNDNSRVNRATQTTGVEDLGGVSKSADILEPKAYVAWVQALENGLKNDKTFDDITFSVQYKPLEYIICMEERKIRIADSIVLRKVNELSDMQYFDLKIALNEGSGELLKYQLSSPQQYSERVNYFAFGLQKDIVLVEGNDTLPCALYHFERAYNVTPSSTFLLGFSSGKNKSPESKTLIIYDRIFNKGMIKMAFDRHDLQKIPKLKTI
jgi:hypothetical protein